MSINTTADDTDSTDLSSNIDEEESLINSAVLVNTSLLTDKQRRVLLATEAFNGRSDVSISAIAKNAAVSHQYVKYVLCKFVDRGAIPADCSLMQKCTPDKEYEDMTETQRRIINESVMSPDDTFEEIAERVGCSHQHAHITCVFYRDILESKRAEVCGE